MKRVCFWAIAALCAIPLIVACCFIAAMIGDVIALHPTEEVVASSPVETTGAITEEETTASPANITEVVTEELTVSLPVETEETTEVVTEPVPRDDAPTFDHAEEWNLWHTRIVVSFVKDPEPKTPWGEAFAAAKAKITDTAELASDAMILAHCIRGEASIISSRTRAIAVAEMILNQVDYNEREFAKIHSVHEAVVDRPGNIHGYWLSIASNTPLQQVYIDLAIEVMARREMERQGWEWSGRILPANVVFEYADTLEGENYFMPYEAYHDLNRAWDWSLPTPYRS